MQTNKNYNELLFSRRSSARISSCSSSEIGWDSSRSFSQGKRIRSSGVWMPLLLMSAMPVHICMKVAQRVIRQKVRSRLR